MATLNSYATLDQYKEYVVARGQTAPADTTNDAVIRDLLNACSRYLDGKTGRKFYPSVETRYYDVPTNETGLGAEREIKFDTDVLEVLSVTNGDGASVPSTEYNLLPKNSYPKNSIKLKSTSTYSWLDTAGDIEGVIAIQVIAGYHDHYDTRAFMSASTLSAGITAAALTWAMAAVSAYEADQIVKVGNEISIVSSVGASDITVTQRGENGSTAAAHNSTDAVKIWHPIDEVREAAILIAHNAYRMRTGQGSIAQRVQVTSAGVVVTNMDVPQLAHDIINTLRNRL